MSVSTKIMNKPDTKRKGYLTKKIIINSGAKINLYLNVSKTLRPDGYHDINSIMQSISLADELEFRVTQIGSGRCGAVNIPDIDNGFDAICNPETDGNVISITCDNIEIPLNEKNLVHKSALLMLKRLNTENKYHIEIKIKKSIPIGSGLAGGSSNAAATLIALKEIFSLDISPEELKYLGNQVGSDVPFCISGGTALVQGKGEKITKLSDMPFYWIVVAINGKKFSSGDVYERFDLVGRESSQNHKFLINNLADKNYGVFFSNIENDLENVVTLEDEMVNILKSKAMSCGAITAQMTGSGPAIFAFCRDLISASKVYSGLKEISNKVFLAHTTATSQNIINC